MFRSIKTLIFILAMLGLGTTMALPPQAEADRQMLAAEAAEKEQRWDDAVTSYEAVQATGAKKRSPDFQFFYGRALVHAGQYAKGKQQLDAYLGEFGERARFYREALMALNAIDQGKKRLAEDQAADAARQAQAQKLQSAWVKLETDLVEMPPGSQGDCSALTQRIKAFSKSARNIECKCRRSGSTHPAFRGDPQTTCRVEWEANKILDGNVSYSKMDLSEHSSDALRQLHISTSER